MTLKFFFYSDGFLKEGFFQSQTFTFGVCGPHQMSPGQVRDP